MASTRFGAHGITGGMGAGGMGEVGVFRRYFWAPTFVIGAS